MNDLTRIYEGVRLGKNVQIGDFCVIGLPPDGTKEGDLETVIGDDSIIRSHAVIYAGNRIGSNAMIGHHVVIRENNEIGDRFKIGSFGEVAFNTRIGNNVSFHSDCHVFEETVIEDGVRFNPGVYVLNTKFPYRPGKKPIIEGVHIGERAIIAARSILMPGIIVGRCAMVGAGSLVTKDVPEYAVVFGRPARFYRDIRELKDEEGESHYKFD